MKTVKYKAGELPPLDERDLARMAAIADDAVDCSDIAPLDSAFWARAERLYQPRKTQITAKIDADVLAWLKSGGKGYQTRLNAILRQAMLKQNS